MSMNAKYSPAPWTETENDDGDLIVRMDKSHSIVVGNLEGSCTTCHANSSLIAAAPELLETVEKLLKIVEQHTSEFTHRCFYKEELDAARALLKRASRTPNVD
jgi:Fe-S cluster biogenesis protein NfuA